LQFLHNTVFSTTFYAFLSKEITAAKNIKNRINRHNVQRLLTKISENIDVKKYKNGLFIYVGIDEFDEEIFELIEPKVKCDIFYYNCGNKFDTHIVKKYLETHSGSIIFANGKECIIYEHKNEFIKKKHINANLIKRHKKGGQSQVRFGRLAEESRTHYVSYIIDHLNQITTKNNWIFGSDEIIGMIMERKNDIYVPIKKGGFYDFDSNSINNASHWLKYLTQIDDDKNDKIYEQILYYLDTKPDFLDFDPTNAKNMKWFITKLPLSNELLNSESNIKLISTSKYYSRLDIFDYIGVKYFNYEIEEK
jgi:hypothetical protein